VADRTQRGDASQPASEWLGEPTEVVQILARITSVAREHLPGVDYVSVCLRHPNGRLETVAATAPLMYEADGMQYDLNEGPAYDAVTDQDAVYSPDLANDARWPKFGPRANALGLASLLAIRLVHPGRLYMCLNLYSITPDAFTAHRDIVAHVFSSHAKEAFDQPQDIDTLRDAMGSMTLVDQATGVLMQRHAIDAERALEIITQLAREQEDPLDAARGIVQAATSRAPGAT
jgi:hypothetical protein